MRRLSVVVGLSVALLAGCREKQVRPEAAVEFTVPPGASFSDVTDTLAERGLVRSPRLFSVYGRLRGDDQRVRAGRYSLAPGSAWGEILEALTTGHVVTEPVTIPEGFRLTQIAERLSDITEEPPDSVLAQLTEPGADTLLNVPGPGLEGYLFPDTYRFTPGVDVDVVIHAMVDRYHAFWTPERRERLDSIGMTERQVVTLASIVQAEARVVEEMPRIASVYRNRLQRGMLLQADPTVLYALGGPRARLLYAAIDSVADSPYNTYRQPGLPPGPIGAPGAAALEAALHPSNEAYLYFVARLNGTHVFSRTLAEHNRNVAEYHRERARQRQQQTHDEGGGRP
ncbi:MAG: endolytic transglycosylase MltG [Gemmatimonadetes bacterium]|nr:endolytic transglycosylase MltG [Gemmatimonadota bacterium]